MEVKLKTLTPNIETNIVEIARVSSSRVNKSEKPEGLINYLIKNKHFSPFEHGFITFEIVTSKAIGIQLLRHRSFTFQEFSQRYSKVTNFEPIEIRQEHPTSRQSSTEVFNPEIALSRYENEKAESSWVIEKTLEEIQRVYNELIDAGVAKECARMILPMCSETTIYMTGSVRSWMHFLEIRDEAHAQKEVQLIAKEIKKLFKDNLPIISKALNYE